MENNKPKKRKKSLYRTRELHLMLFPAVIFTALFCYLPIGGLIMGLSGFQTPAGLPEICFRGSETVPLYFYDAELPSGLCQHDHHCIF